MKTNKNKVLFMGILAFCLFSAELINSQTSGTTNDTFTVNSDDNGTFGEVKLISGGNKPDWGLRSLLGNLIFASHDGPAYDQKMEIKSNGNVGIGTSYPQYKLQVAGAMFSEKYVVQNNQDGGTSRGIYMWNANDTNWGIYMASAGAGKNLQGGIAPAGHNFNSHSIRFRAWGSAGYTNNGFIWENSANENIMSLNSGSGDLMVKGKLGIGTTSPSQKLDVDGNIKTNAIRVMNRGSHDLRDSNVLMEVATNSYGTIRGYNGDQHLGTIHFFDDTWGNGTPSNSSNCINLSGSNGVTLGSWNNPTLYANSSGQVAIGTTDIIEGTSLHVDGRVYISEDGGAEEGFGSGFTANDNFKDYLLWVEEGIVSTDFALSELADWPDYVFEEKYQLNSLNDMDIFIKKNGHLPTMPTAEDIKENGFSVGKMTINVVKTIEELTLHTIEQQKKIDEQSTLIDEQNTLLKNISLRLAIIEDKAKK
jgi:hypothetical protein